MSDYTHAELLTPDEHLALTQAAELVDTLSRVIGNGLTRTDDIYELMFPIHAIQHAVMSQAAARAYPGLYRLLGEVIPTTEGGDTP